MKKPMMNLFVVMISIALSQLPALATGKPPAEEEQLPDFSLPMPKDPAYREYLGLVGGDSFGISQINAKVIVIEIFSMYCPYCQREAPEVNLLHQKIESNPELKGKIKLVGIGAGNSPFEVDIFRKKYNVPFPLFPDESFSIHKCIGEVRTPYFFVVKINDDGTHKIVYSGVGGLKGADRFLKTILDGLVKSPN